MHRTRQFDESGSRLITNTPQAHPQVRVELGCSLLYNVDVSNIKIGNPFWATNVDSSTLTPMRF